MEDSPKGPPEDLLSSWKEIAVYLDTTERTVQRWERDGGLPVRRLLHKKKASVYAYKSEIETWRASRDIPAELAAELGPSSGDSMAPQPQRRFRAGVAVGVLFAFAVLVFASYRWQQRPGHSPRVAPLTSLEGLEFSPAFSPDGTRVAFCWQKPGRGDYDIFVVDADGGRLAALAETEYPETSPAWSPDGEKLAYLRYKPRRSAQGWRAEIVVLEPATGEESIVASRAPRTSVIHWLLDPRLAWDLDSRALFVTGGNLSRRGIYRYDIETTHLDRLTETPSGAVGDFEPSLSPDGKLLTFVRKWGLFLGDVHVIDLEDPNLEPKQLTSWGRWTRTPTFTLDGTQILVSSGDVGGERRFWSLDPSGRQEPRLLALGGEGSVGLTLAASGAEQPRMAFTRVEIQSDIWRTDLREGGKTERIIASSRMDSNPALSPDGARLVFESNRSGRPELWISDADGGDQRQLTTDAPPLAGAAEWSPDGGRLAASAVMEGQVEIVLVSPTDGTVTQLTGGDGDKLYPRWAPEGDKIHFHLDRPGGPGYIAQISAEGGRIERRIGGLNVVVAVDSPQGDLFTVTTSGNLAWAGAEGQVSQELQVGRPASLQATAEGLAFLADTPGSNRPGIYLRGYEGGEPELLTPVDDLWQGLAVSSDATQLYYSRIEEQEADLQLVEEVW